MKKRLTVVILAAVLALTLLPVAALNALGDTGDNFVAVERIVGIKTYVSVGTEVSLGGTVIPYNATYTDIVYSQAADNTLLCEMSGDGSFVSSTTGIAKLIATIKDGKGPGTDYTQAVDVNVVNPPKPPEVDDKRIFANGNALIIAAGKTDGHSTIYIDKNDDGKLDLEDRSLKSAGVTGAPDDNSDLKGYTVFGGGNTDIEYNTKITMLSGHIGHIYGGGNEGAVTGDTNVNMSGGTVRQSVFGGGYGGAVTGDTNVNISGGTVTRSVSGVGEERASTVSGTKTVSVSGSAVIGSINADDPSQTYGIQLDTITNNRVTISGTFGTRARINLINPSSTEKGTVVATATNSSYIPFITTLTMRNATLKTVAKGSGAEVQIDTYYTTKMNPSVDQYNIYANGTALIITGTADNSSTIYIDLDRDGFLDDDEPSLAGAQVPNAPKDGADLRTHSIFGGGNTDGKYDTMITMLSGRVKEIYGGGNSGAVHGSTSVKINGGVVRTTIYGGGNSNVNGSTSVTMNGGTVGDVFGGGKTAR